jgi:hypothetical protein
VDGFPRFMSDRAEVERWKQTFALYFGEVKGDPTPGSLGLHPGGIEAYGCADRRSGAAIGAPLAFAGPPCHAVGTLRHIQRSVMSR